MVLMVFLIFDSSLGNIVSKSVCGIVKCIEDCVFVSWLCSISCVCIDWLSIFLVIGMKDLLVGVSV